MNCRISHIQRLARIGGLAMTTAILVACSTAQPVGQQSSLELVQLPKASFQLKSVQVVWIDNPSIPIKASFVNFKHAPVVDPGRMDRAKENVVQIMKAMREHAPEQLASALTKEGVAKGIGHTITLTPVGAYRDEAGWGSGAIIQVSISSDSKQALWSMEMDANSGWQWLGPDALPPGDTYAKNLAKGTIEAFKKAGLIQ